MVYSVKANAFDSVHNWFLTDDAITREQNGVHNLKILYTDIKRLRLYYNPMRFKPDNYECEIVTFKQQKYKIRSSSFESIANFASQPETYNPFVKELVANVSAKNKRCEIITGLTKSAFILSYGMTLLIVLGVGALLAIFAGPLPAALLMFGYYLYYIVKGFKKNWPKNIVNHEISDKVLPSGG